MNHSPNLDPELRLLLQHVASDPNARIFRTRIPEPRRLAFSDVPRISLRAAGLTFAEREILRAYREDVAKLLRDAAEWKIQQDPLGAASSYRYSSPQSERRFPGQNELTNSLLAREEWLHRTGISASEASGVRAGEALLLDPSADAAQLAGLSMRFAMHDAAWIHVGRALLLEGRSRPAMTCLGGVVRRAQAASLQASALTYIGSAYSGLGLHRNAHAAFAAGARLDDGDPNCWLAEFAEAVSSGEVELAREAGRRLDERMPARSPAVEQWILQCRARRSINPQAWLVRSLPHRMLMLMDSLGPTARLVADELR